MRNAPYVAIGELGSNGRYSPGVVAIVRADVFDDGHLTLIITTIARSARSGADGDDVITIDLDAPARELVHRLGRSSSSVLRAIFGGLV